MKNSLIEASNLIDICVWSVIEVKSLLAFLDTAFSSQTSIYEMITIV